MNIREGLVKPVPVYPWGAAWHQHNRVSTLSEYDAKAWDSSHSWLEVSMAASNAELIVCLARVTDSETSKGVFVCPQCCVLACVPVCDCRSNNTFSIHLNHLESCINTTWYYLTQHLAVCTHVHVFAQTLLDHLRASWWRDWAAARMGWLTGWLDGIISSSGS